MPAGAPAGDDTDRRRRIYLITLIFTVLLFALVVVIYARMNRASWYHPLTLYIGFHGLVFVIRPVMSQIYDYDFVYNLYRFMPSPYEKSMALMAANLGLVAFAAASLYFGREVFVFKHDPFEKQRRARLVRSFMLTLAIFSPLALYSIYDMWIDRATGYNSYLFDSSTGTTINTSGVGYLKEFQLTLIPLTVLFAWVMRFRLLSLLPLAIFIFLRAGTGGRGPIIMALFALGCFYLYEKRRYWIDGRVLAGLAVGLMIFTTIAADRGASIRALFIDDVGTIVMDSDNQLAPLEGMDFANLEYLEYLVYTVPQRTGTYEYFVNQLQVFTEPVPRALWSEKPVGPPVPMFNLFDYGNPVGITRSLPGEGWTQLGFLGVLFWCGLWGGILGRIYSGFARSDQSTFRAAAYFCLLALLIIFFRNGLLLSLLRQGLFIFAPIVVWMVLSQMMAIPTADRLRHFALRRAGLETEARGMAGTAPSSAQVPAAAPAPLRVTPAGPGWEGGLVPRAWRNGPGATRKPS